MEMTLAQVQSHWIFLIQMPGAVTIIRGQKVLAADPSGLSAPAVGKGGRLLGVCLGWHV